MAEARLRVAREFLADAKLCLDNGRYRVIRESQAAERLKQAREIVELIERAM